MLSEESKERIARAICEACDENPDFRGDCRGNEFRWQDYLPVANAAIDAVLVEQVKAEPVAYRAKVGGNYVYAPQFTDARAEPLYLHPAPVPEGMAKASSLRYGAAVIELYDDAEIAAHDHMLSSTECASILEVLAEREEAMIAAAPVVRPAPEGMDKQCEWYHCGDEYMPGTWDGECGAKWTFTEGGPVENNMRFCPECGGEVVIAAAEKETGK